MSQNSIIRHQEIFDPAKHEIPVTIIGAGATGSRVFEALVNLGVRDITVFDFDTVEEHNLANQLFVKEDISEPKVDGLVRWFKRKTGGSPPPSINLRQHKVTNETPKEQIGGIVFLLTDTMASREEIYEHCLKDNIQVISVIETRMASAYGDVYTFDPNLQGEQWKKTLIKDDEAEVSTCGSSISVGSTASVIANWAVWQYKLIAKGFKTDAHISINLMATAVAAEGLPA